MMIFFLTIKRSLAQSAHSSQLTAHSSQSLILIKIIFYFTIQNLLLKRAVSEFLCDSFALQIIRWLLFFYVLADYALQVVQAEACFHCVRLMFPCGNISVVHCVNFPHNSHIGYRFRLSHESLQAEACVSKEGRGAHCYYKCRLVGELS